MFHFLCPLISILESSFNNKKIYTSFTRFYKLLKKNFEFEKSLVHFKKRSVDEIKLKSIFDQNWKFCVVSDLIRFAIKLKCFAAKIKKYFFQPKDCKLKNWKNTRQNIWKIDSIFKKVHFAVIGKCSKVFRWYCQGLVRTSKFRLSSFNVRWCDWEWN